MTALHWLAFNNDNKAITELLKNDADALVWTHDGQLPVDIAGTMPNPAALDALLEHYSSVNKLHEPQEFHTNMNRVNWLLKLCSQGNEPPAANKGLFGMKTTISSDKKEP